MDINVNIKIDAPELAGVIQSWFDAFGLAVEAYDKETEGPIGTATEPEPESETKGPAEEKTAPNITLERVRAKLAALSQSGKQAEVKKLIANFGARKLTEIPQEKYLELLKKAEEI